MSGLTCQECKQPVQIDESLSDLTPSNYELIVGSIPKAPGSGGGHSRQGTTHDLLARTPGHPSVKAAWERSQGDRSERGSVSARRKAAGSSQSGQRQRASIGGGESFVLLQDSIVRNLPASPPNGPYSPKGKGKVTVKEKDPTLQTQTVSPTTLSHHLRSVTKLYSLLSTKTEVDHPLCDECMHLLLGMLEKQLEETKKERDGYIAFEKQIKKERERVGDNSTVPADAERRLEDLKLEERSLMDDLRDADRERELLEAELKQLEREEKMLEEEEAEYALPTFGMLVLTVWTGSGDRIMQSCWLNLKKMPNWIHCAPLV